MDYQERSIIIETDAQLCLLCRRKFFVLSRKKAFGETFQQYVRLRPTPALSVREYLGYWEYWEYLGNISGISQLKVLKTDTCSISWGISLEAMWSRPIPSHLVICRLHHQSDFQDIFRHGQCRQTD